MSIPEWIARYAPDETAVKQALDVAIAEHTEWDTPHLMTLLRWHDGHLCTAMLAQLPANIESRDFAGMFAGAVKTAVPELIRRGTVADPVAVLMFEFEAWTTLPDQPERFETAGVIAADIMGRVWAASKTRGTDGAPDTVRAARSAARDDGLVPDAVRGAIALVPLLYAGFQ